MKPQGFIPPSASPSAHEGADLDVPIVLRVAVALGITLVGSVLLIAVFFHYLEHTYGPRTSEAAPIVTIADLPPTPRVQTSPWRDLQALREVEDSHLYHYGWIDRQHAIAQIPVDRAMVLWVKSCSANPNSPAPSASAAVPRQSGLSAPNAPSQPGTTELQMRQQKAQESLHVP